MLIGWFEYIFLLNFKYSWAAHYDTINFLYERLLNDSKILNKLEIYIYL